MIFIPPKDSEHCITNFFDTETCENLGQVKDIKEVNITSKCQIDYGRYKHGNILTRCVHDPTYEFTFNADKPIDTKEFYRILGIDIANMPDAYDIQFIKFVQARKHKKRRINKKWLKRYGYKEIQNKNKTYMIDGKLYMTQRCYNKMKKILEKENKINNCEVEING